MSTLKVDTLQNSVGENLVFGNKNLLINGGMNVWQRATTASVSTNIYSTVDRWKTSVGGLGAFTISRSTDVPSGQGFGYSAKWDCTTADASPAANDFLMMQQILEGQNLQHLLKGTSSAKKLTLSFWVKSNKTGTYIANLYDNDNDRDICKSYTISSANTWEKKELTFDGDTTGVFDNDNNASLYLQMWLGAGSTYSSGTLATSWATRVQANRAVGQVNLADSTSNELYITGIQLEVGSKATDFEFEPFQKVLNKCQRYFMKYSTGSAGDRVTQAQAEGTGSAVAFFHLPTPLRAKPSVTLSDMNLRNSSSNFTISSVSGIRPDIDNPPHVSFSCNTSGLTNTRSYQLRMTSASGSVSLNSEL
jgi:phage gp37-like protein